MDVEEALERIASTQWSAGYYAREVGQTLAAEVLRLRAELDRVLSMHGGVRHSGEAPSAKESPT